MLIHHKNVGLLEYKAQLFARQTTDYLISTHLEYKATVGKIVSTNCIKITMIAHLSCLRGKRLSEHENTKGLLYKRKWHTKPLM